MRRRPVATRRWVAVVAAGACLAAACSGSGDDADRATSTSTGIAAPLVPGVDWDEASPADLGLDGAVLDQVAATAEAGKSTCLVVVRDGRLAGSWTFGATGPDTTRNVFSVTKSVASTLVGIAQGDGDLDIDQPASTWITEWKGTPSESVTVRDLLSNTSGRQWSLALDYAQLVRAADRTAYAIGLGQDVPPGQVWAYNNSAIQTLQRVLESATGQEVTAYARERLFEPLGMAHTSMVTDRSGHAQVFEGLRSSCEDLARFGLLLLREGRWGDRQIVSRAWVAEATGRPSSSLNAAYGYLWWLNRPGVLAGPVAATSLAPGTTAPVRSRLVPGAPESMFWALGLGNQLVQVDPGSRTVVVRLGTAEAQPQPPTFGPAEASRVVVDAVVR